MTVIFKPLTLYGWTVKGTPTPEHYPPASRISQIGEEFRACILDDSVRVEGANRSRAELNNWSMGELIDVWFGAKILLPSDFEVLTAGHCSFVQLHFKKGIACRIHVKQNGEFRIRKRVWNYQRNQLETIVMSDDLEGIYDEYFDVKMHLIIGEYGEISVWINNFKVLTHIGDLRTSPETMKERIGVSFKLGIYQALNNGNKCMTWKKAICATTEREVDNYLKGIGVPEPEPEPEPEYDYEEIGKTLIALLGLLELGAIGE